MELFFNNDGTYDQKAVLKPVKCKDVCVGVIKSVSEDIVTIELWSAYPSTCGYYMTQKAQNVVSFELV